MEDPKLCEFFQGMIDDGRFCKKYYGHMLRLANGYENGKNSGEKEIYMPLKGFNDKYEISNYGNIMAGKRILKQSLDKYNYRIVTLNNNGHSKRYVVWHLMQKFYKFDDESDNESDDDDESDNESDDED